MLKDEKFFPWLEKKINPEAPNKPIKIPNTALSLNFSLKIKNPNPKVNKGVKEFKKALNEEDKENAENKESKEGEE